VEDIVAVELKTPSGVPHCVMTFGRIQEAVDPTDVESIVLEHASRIGLSEATSAEVCWSLRDARDAPYFYEALVDFAASLAAREHQDYEERRERTDRQMHAGEHLWYCGDPSRAPER
jgi:hypothetical protein